jgi:hypothetical protein
MLNFGRLIEHTSRQLAGAYLLVEQADVAGAESNYLDFHRHVAASPLLRAEYLAFHNLRRQGLDPTLVREYARDNAASLGGFSARQLADAHAGLASFMGLKASPASALDESIQTLLSESLAPAGERRVHAYHAALNLVCESLASAAPVAAEPVEGTGGFSLDQLLRGAAGPLQEQLARLDAGERALLRVVSGGDEVAQRALFEQYLAEANVLLEAYADSPAAQRLRGMRFSAATAGDDLLDLHALLRPDPAG